MRSATGLTTLCLTAGLAVFASAQDADKDAALLANLSQLERESWEAMVAGNKEFFRSYLAPKATWVFADGTLVEGDAFLAGGKSFEVKKYSMGPASLRRISEDVVLIMYRLSYEAVQDGRKELFADIQSSSLYVHRDGKWLESFYQETPVHGASHGTADEAKRMVARGIERYKKDGAAAFEAFNTGSDGFRDRDLYLFVAEAGPGGKVLAYGGAKQAGSQIGKLLADVKSPDGDPIGQMTLKAATEQGAWVDYGYVDPVTNKVEHKFSWVVRHDGKIFGCGIYVPGR